MLATLTRLVSVHFEVVGAVRDAVAVLREARRLHPDVVVLEIFMPVIDGFAVGRQIKREFPHTRLIYVTLDPDPRLNAEAMRIGAFALVPKASAVRQLPDAIRRAMAETKAAT